MYVLNGLSAEFVMFVDTRPFAIMISRFSKTVSALYLTSPPCVFVALRICTYFGTLVMITIRAMQSQGRGWGFWVRNTRRNRCA